MKFNQRIAIFVILTVSICANITYSAPTTTPANKSTLKGTAETKQENKNNVQTTSAKPDVKTINKVTVKPKDSKEEKKEVKNKKTVAKIESKVTVPSSTTVVPTSTTVVPTSTKKVQSDREPKKVVKNKSGVESVKTDKKDNPSISDKQPQKKFAETTKEKGGQQKENINTENKPIDKMVNLGKTNTEKSVKKAVLKEKVDQKAKSSVSAEHEKVVEDEKVQAKGGENTKTDLTRKKDKKSNNDKKSPTNVIRDKMSESTSSSNKDVKTSVQQTGKNVAKRKKLESKSEIKTDNSNNERRSNVRRNVITTSTTTQATVTELETATTWDGLPCSSRFRAHPVDKTRFETAFAEDVFEKIYQSCPSPLIWRQDQCRCGWPEPEVIENCNCCVEGLKAHPKNTTMYLRLVNGQWLEEKCSTYDNNQLWDDEKCSCIWDPNKPQSHKAPVFKGAVLPRRMTKCMNLVNMTLDNGLKDANGRDLTPPFGRQRIRVVDEKGSIGKSVEIRRAPFKLGIFNGNDLQSTVYFKFNFKVHRDKVRMRKKMVIMTNGCKRSWQRKALQPSLEVSFFPYNETFEVRFSTSGKTVVEYMTGTKDANGWYQCVLYLQDRVLNLKVNGKKVYSTNGMSGGVKTTDCPLTVAGSPTNPKNNFDGYLDELQIVKQCKYEPETGP